MGAAGRRVTAGARRAKGVGDDRYGYRAESSLSARAELSARVASPTEQGPIDGGGAALVFATGVHEREGQAPGDANWRVTV